MPAMFALGTEVIGNAQLATFAAFGSFAMLLLVDFSGPMHERVFAQLGLGVLGAVFVCLGTLASANAVVAAVAMAVVGFVVLFVGVVSSVLAGATTSLLISFILPVTTTAPASQIPDRLAGWGLASGAALVAVTLLWPAPYRQPLRSSAIVTLRTLSETLRVDGAAERADAAVRHLQTSFFATPYRPTGLGSSARALVRLVDELGWLSRIAELGRPSVDPSAGPEVCAVNTAVAELLSAGAELLEAPRSDRDTLGAELARLRAALVDLEYRATGSMPVTARDVDDRARAVVDSLEPGFRAQELAFAVSVVAANIERVVAAEKRSWWHQLLGHRPDGISSPLSAAHERAAAHAERHSVWLHNSLRGAAALGVAVLVADLTGVQHSFWVVLGALSVLRSTALNTGQNAVRGIAGTVGGFVVGGVLVAVVGTDTTVLWFLLPVAVLLAGLAPATISFAAGQGAFTLTLLILYNLIAPVGWHVGVARIEDIAIGCGVSLAVGLLFWPRGAGSVLGRALAEAYTDSATYLRSAVGFALQRCQGDGGPATAPTSEPYAAAASARRLDDAFRSYLAERGGKPVPLAEVTALVTGVAGLRLAADAVLDLWDTDDVPPGDRAPARRELTSEVDRVSGWYDTLAGALDGSRPVPEPLDVDAGADARLLEAVRRDLSDDDHATATAVRVVWTADHIDAARRLEAVLVDPARAAAAARASRSRRLARPRGG
ncbi:MAG: FUSC family protein [Jatrophihabitans endophyticus]|nr:FUSC family protein [Jatrophihabitans endophyticus]